MGDYYTNTSEYSPVPTGYQEQAPAMQQPNAVSYPATNVAMTNPNYVPNQYKYNNDVFNVDFKDVLKRVIKYLVEGLAVAFVAYYFVGRNKLDIKDIVMLGITAAFVFAILDTFSPTISLGARFGAGFGIGQGLFGLNPTVFAGPGLAAI